MLTIPGSRFYQYPYLIDEEIEAQKILIICTRPNYVKWASSIHIRLSGSTAHVLKTLAFLSPKKMYTGFLI